MSDRVCPVTIEGNGARLRGVLHAGAGDDAGGPHTGVVFLHGWSGCRLGPHRMFVKTARRLAAQNCTCLRFDFAGRGESDGGTAAASIATMTDDACAGVEYLRQERGIERIVLLGICSGSKVAISAAVQRPEVQALALWSAEAMGHLASPLASRARESASALRTYLRKVAAPETWKKLASGRINFGLIRRAILKQEVSSRSEKDHEDEVLRRFRGFHRPALFVFGGKDPDTALASQNYRTFCDDADIPAEFHVIADAGHSFYSLEAEETVMHKTEVWLERVRGEMS